MPKLIKLENAALNVLVIEPAVELVSAGVTKSAAAGGRPAHLDASPFLAAPLGAVPASRASVLRGKVSVDGEEFELPHDDPEVLADFVECTYVLHGWRALNEISEELSQMLLYMDNPLQFEREIGAVAQSPSGGVILPNERMGGGYNESRRAQARARKERLPGGVILEDDLPSRGVNLPDPAGQARLFNLRRRIGAADIIRIREWQTAFDKARTDLRVRVLRVARLFEEEALRQVRLRTKQSGEVVMLETARYFQWHLRDAVEAALNALNDSDAQPQQKPVEELRVRLTKLLPAAKAAVAAEETLDDFQTSRVFSTERPLSGEELAKGTKLKAAFEKALADYGAALAIDGAEYPVLFRFDPATLIKAERAAESGAHVTLGRLLFTRLKRTWEAAQSIRSKLHKNRPAKQVSEVEISGGTAPETLIGRDSKDSIWAYPKLIEATCPQMPIEDLELAECVVTNVRAVMKTHAELAATLGIVKGIGLTGLQIAMMSVCPAAGVALDIGMAAADIQYSVNEYNDLSDAALCDLNPRESLAEVEPSAAPVVLAVAGAALVAV